MTLDTGHAFVAGENMAESAVFLSDYGRRLFHLHFNDNYRSWDDDMIVGSVHLVEFIELLFWLREIGYEGWYSMDQYPYREDGQGALRSSVEFLQGIEALLDEARWPTCGPHRRGRRGKSTSWLGRKLLGKR